jgi:hypothetical protein
MVDFPDSSMLPVQRVSRATDDRSDNNLQHQKRRPLVKPRKVEDAEHLENDEQKHSLDLDA